MIRSKLLQCVSYNRTRILLSSTQTDKKLEHYKNLDALQDTESKPEGWDTAKPFESLPGPKPWPIIGNLMRFMKGGEFHNVDFLDVHKQFYKQYGEIVILKGMMRHAMVLLYNPKDFETLFRNEGVWPIRRNLPSLDYYAKMKKGTLPNMGLVASHGEEWFKIRSMVNPVLMQPRNVAQYTDKMNLVADELVENIKYFAEKNPDGEMPTDFRNEIYKWSLESIGVVTLDTHLGCLKRDLKEDSEPQRMINSALQFFELMFKLDFQPSMWKYYSTPDWKKFVAALDFLAETNIKHINRAIEQLEKDESETGNETKSMLQQLLKKDRHTAIGMAIDMMQAGIDTTGRILGAGLYYLAKNPEKQEKLRSEAKALLQNKNTPITKEVLAKAPYLKAVVKETTRLAPIGAGNMRTTIKDLVLGGYQIPKGTDVFAANLTLCLSDEYFPKAKEFIPERWLSSTFDEFSHKNVSPFLTLPFGFGPRSCIGKRIANLELDVAFLKIIRNFEVSWPHEDMKFATAALYGIASPLKIRVKPLQN